MKLPRWIAWLLHRLPMKAKAKAFDVAVDKMSRPDREVIPPTQKFIDPGTGSRLGRGLDKRKKNPNS